MKNNLCLNDFFAIITVLLVAIALFFAPMLVKSSADYVKITTAENEQVFSLLQNKIYSVDSNGHTVTVKIENREVYVIESTCPDKICVNSRKISRGGEVIVCAPALVSVEIIGERGDVDYAVG